METIDAIKMRRSIRKYKRKDIEKDKIEKLLEIATRAPSGKNSQPWKFLVLKGNKKNQIANFMIKNASKLKEEGFKIGSTKSSANIIKEAPVLIMVYNENKKHYIDVSEDAKARWRSVDIQSIGAAIQNLLLGAVDMGLGTLWICDVFIAIKDINNYLNMDSELVAGVAVGYQDENPESRQRKELSEVVEFR